MTNVRRALLWQLLGLALALLIATGLAHAFPLLEIITRAQRRIGEMEFWGGLLYPLLYAICNVLLLPAGVLAIGSGLFFGLWWGFILNLAGNVGGAAIAFSIARGIGRGSIERRFLQQERWRTLDQAIARDGWKIIFLTQLHPLFPSSLLNYLYGITRMPFGSCMLWVALGQSPGLFLYAYLGTLGQLGLRLARGQTHPRHSEYFLWLGGLSLTIMIIALLARVAVRLLEAAQNEAAGAPRMDLSADVPKQPRPAPKPSPPAL